MHVSGNYVARCDPGRSGTSAPGHEWNNFVRGAVRRPSLRDGVDSDAAATWSGGDGGGDDGGFGYGGRDPASLLE